MRGGAAAVPSRAGARGAHRRLGGMRPRPQRRSVFAQRMGKLGVAPRLRLSLLGRARPRSARAAIPRPIASAARRPMAQISAGSPAAGASSCWRSGCNVGWKGDHGCARAAEQGRWRLRLSWCARRGKPSGRSSRVSRNSTSMIGPKWSRRPQPTSSSMTRAVSVPIPTCTRIGATNVIGLFLSRATGAPRASR